MRRGALPPPVAATGGESELSLQSYLQSIWDKRHARGRGTHVESTAPTSNFTTYLPKFNGDGDGRDGQRDG
jgi:hypothetical protein